MEPAIKLHAALRDRQGLRVGIALVALAIIGWLLLPIASKVAVLLFVATPAVISVTIGAVIGWLQFNSTLFVRSSIISFATLSVLSVVSFGAITATSCGDLRQRALKQPVLSSVLLDYTNVVLLAFREIDIGLLQIGKFIAEHVTKEDKNGVELQEIRLKISNSYAVDLLATISDCHELSQAAPCPKGTLCLDAR
jgi:hypothetical protein